MDQDKTDPAQRPQTLLEAAKTLSAGHTAYIATPWANLRAAIAREEERPPATTDGERRCWEGLVDSWRKGHDEQAARAKQAEAERDLAKSQLALSLSRLERQSVLILSATQASGCRIPEDVSDSIRRLRARAEKAEAECREQRARAESGEDRNRDLSEKLIAAHGKTHAESERAKKAEGELAKAKSHPMDDGEITVMLNRAGVKAWGNRLPQGMTTPERIEWLIDDWNRMGQQLSRLCELQANPPVIVTQPFEGDPQTCAFGSNAFGGKPKRDDADEDPVDPTTGFTFATYRRLLEALGGKS